MQNQDIIVGPLIKLIMQYFLNSLASFLSLLINCRTLIN